MKISARGRTALVKVITVKLFAEGNVSHRTFRIKAGERRGFTERQVNEVLDELITRIEKETPDIERRLVQIAPNAFNFVAVEKAALEPVGANP